SPRRRQAETRSSSREQKSAEPEAKRGRRSPDTHVRRPRFASGSAALADRIGVCRMPKFSWETAEKLKEEWTDRLVMARADKPELKRFEGKVGRVVTVNWAGKAIVDFADGAWYDIPASEEYLTPLAADDANRAKYN